MLLHLPGLCRFPFRRLMIVAICGLRLVVVSAPGQSGGSGTNNGTRAAPPPPPSRDSAVDGGPEWFFFPINPPTLGAEVAVAAVRRPSIAPPLLRVFLTEPFYAPLAVRIVEVEGEPHRSQLMVTEEFVRFDSFLGIRSALVKELLDRADAALRLEPLSRLAAFETFAKVQGPRLEEMETTAEWLRESLARSDPWSEYRQWRLNRGSLKQPRDKTYVLEFQVVRAAAYYQAGFSPAQRRLIRELAIEMSEFIATRGKPETDFVFFFSPDTTRLMRPRTAPRELETMLARYSAEKGRLKDELREVIYETDGVLLEYTRTRRIEELAAAQAGAIEQLELLAEKIRRELVLLPDFPRYRRHVPLTAALEGRLQAFAENVQKISDDRVAFVRRHMQQARSQPGETPPTGVVYDTVARARAAFDIQQGNRLMAHEREAEAILAGLYNELSPEDAARLDGAADVAIRDYLERRAERDAYSEYDLAVLEPGLSPAQRRLLLASAMSRLRQVLPPPEPAPTGAPGTLLGIER